MLWEIGGGAGTLNSRCPPSVKSSLRTAVRGFREAVEAGEKDKAAELLVSTSRKLDQAASKGVIHKNQAANKKSALAQALNKL